MNEMERRNETLKMLSDDYGFKIDYDRYCGTFIINLGNDKEVTCNFSYDEFYGWDIWDDGVCIAHNERFDIFSTMINKLLTNGINVETATKVVVCLCCLRMVFEYPYYDLDEIYDFHYPYYNDCPSNMEVFKDILNEMECIMHRIVE